MDTLTPDISASEPRLKVYTTRRCSDCVVAKTLLTRLAIPFEEIDIEADPAAAAYVIQVNGGRRSVPTLVVGDDAESLSRFNRARFEAFLSRHQLLVTPETSR